ncbi:hypothetical protein [Lichenibacterium ramalinae]|uniref:Uncharacterized protein n=1 Tax=Lichenibacterium ramalinae TaxID=2316527 RepID=A0A4Q2R7G1_9HYPH|nr:hypothetical protein [Lichenibacterium ramalinae]RYB01340.1 hypothetical protein D3272_26665 [Lichenibacterium ramalinae]
MAGKQKAPELSAGLLAVKGTAAPAVDMKPRVPEPEAPPKAEPAVADEPAESDRNDAPLNFRVSADFRREFKTYAAQHDLKLNELLRRAFDVYKRQGDR